METNETLIRMYFELKDELASLKEKVSSNFLELSSDIVSVREKSESALRSSKFASDYVGKVFDNTDTLRSAFDAAISELKSYFDIKISKLNETE